MYLTDLANVLRKAGLKVVEVSGWKTRGHGGMNAPRGIIWHHTATPASAKGNYPSQGIVTHGRSDLPGPLCNLGLGRDGTWYVIAAGCAWHAGSGSHSGMAGNMDTIGIEAEHPGTAGNPWPAEQLASYRRGSAALANAYKIPVSRVIGHKEWTSRKIDPYGLNMAVEREHVKHYMNNPGAAGDWLDMASKKDVIDAVNETWTAKHVKDIKAVVSEVLDTPIGSTGKTPRQHWATASGLHSNVLELQRESDAHTAAIAKLTEMVEFLVKAVKAEQAK